MSVTSPFSADWCGLTAATSLLQLRNVRCVDRVPAVFRVSAASCCGTRVAHICYGGADTTVTCVGHLFITVANARRTTFGHFTTREWVHEEVWRRRMTLCDGVQIWPPSGLRLWRRCFPLAVAT